MAQRRMFSPQIVESEEFLTMPVSSQALYFHLGMNADDDGFIQPKITMRVTGANEDDLKVLLAKRFLLPFESGVVVIKHWLIHNLIQKDRYHPTRFLEEKKTLFIKGNKAYTDNPDSVNKMLTQVRLGKVKKDKIKTREAPQSGARIVVSQEILKGKEWNELIDSFKPVNPMYLEFYKNKTERSALELLVKTMGLEKLKNTILVLPKIINLPYAPKITKPTELKRDLGKLVAFYNQEKLKITSKKVNVIV